MSNKRYFWLKLHENFFQRNDIKIIESQKNGSQYLIFYLKLLAESIKKNGDLRFNDYLAFNDEMLSTITNTDIDIVRTAMKLFQALGLIEVKEDQTIYMIETKSMTGSETEYAKKKRAYREQLKQQKMIEDKQKTKKDNVRQEIELDKELDLEKDLEKELERELDLEKDFKDNKKITLALIKSLFKTLNLKSSAEEFYNYYEAREWQFSNGNQIKIKALESLSKSWEAKEDKFKRKNINNGKGSSKAPDIDKPEWIDDYIDEIANMKG